MDSTLSHTLNRAEETTSNAAALDPQRPQETARHAMLLKQTQAASTAAAQVNIDTLEAQRRKPE